MISIACQIINCDVDDTYVGRVLNRFSKDIGYMDDQLQVMFSFYLVVIKLCSIINVHNSDQFLQLFSYLTGICVLAVVASYWNIIPVIFLFVIFFILRWLFVTASRDLKRLEALCKIACIHFMSRSYILSQLAVPSFLICPLLFKVYLSFAPTQCSFQPWRSSMLFKTRTHRPGTCI